MSVDGTAVAQDEARAHNKQHRGSRGMKRGKFVTMVQTTAIVRELLEATSGIAQACGSALAGSKPNGQHDLPSPSAKRALHVVTESMVVALPPGVSDAYGLGRLAQEFVDWHYGGARPGWVVEPTE